MNKISCDVMGDLLPLYVDDVVSADTRDLVEEHLQSCPSCQEKLEAMRQPVVLPDFRNVQEQDTQTLKGIKKKLKQKRLLVSFCSILLTVALVFAIWFFRQPTSIDAVLEDIAPPFSVGDVLTSQEVDDGLTLVLYRNQDDRNALQSALIRKHGPLYRLVRCSGSLELAPVGQPDPGQLRSRMLISWYDRDNPEKCVVLAVAYDEAVEAISYCDTPLERIDFEDYRLFFGAASGKYELYQLYDRDGNELEHYAN